jgi:hypothetical protein
MKRAVRHRVSSNVSKHGVQTAKAQTGSPVEALEARVFLSGTVLASVVQGSLHIRGDAAANAIVVDQAGLTANQVRITGTSGTTINNQSGPIVLSGITHGSSIRMGGGADNLTLTNLSLPGNVSITAAEGADALTLNGVTIERSLSILELSSTRTRIAIANTTVGQDLAILPSPGGQSIYLQSIVVQRHTGILTGKGADTLAVDDSTFHGPVQLETWQGNDTVQIDSNGDPSGPTTQFDGPVKIFLDGGNDTLQLGVAGQLGNRSVFAGKVFFGGGLGLDTLSNFDASTYIGKSGPRIKNFEANTPTHDATVPTVSSTTPANNATGVAINQKIAATFSKVMDPLTLTATTLTVTAPGGVAVPGTVSYAGTTATFTPTSDLAASTVFTATVTTGAKDLAGNPLASNFVWSFTTGVTADTTAPSVVFTDPASNATSVALNQKIAATFSKSMDPLTITTADLTVTGPGGAALTGTVSYDSPSKVATFTPSSNLAPNTLYTATVTTGAKDLAGNALASNFSWTFTSGATADTSAPTVTSTSPSDLQTNVVLNKTVAATFSKSMDPLTITTADVTVTGPGNAPVMGTVSYDAQSEIATFTPSSDLASNTSYTATIIGGANGVKDLAGNPLANNKVWSFTTGTQVAQAPINLGSASTFAVMATASISGTGPTQINGDVGLNPGSAEGIPPAEVNGTIHIDDQAIIKAQSDLLAAYNDAVSRSTTSQSLPGNMGGLTFTPGLYTNSTSVLIQGAGPANNVTLDAQGDPNAIFIFQMGSTLTTGSGAQVILAGGAKASNVFWQVGSSATLNTTTIFEGNILASVTITVDAGSVVDGRLLGGSNSSGSVTVNASTVTVPAP